jgi:hypothetical protein
MEKTLDFSQAKLETQSVWKRRLWQSVLVLLLGVGIIGLASVIFNPDEQIGWTLLQYGSFALIVLPATGWFYHKFSYYIRLGDDSIEVKQIQKKKEVFPLEMVDHVAFSNNNLYVTLENGEEKQYDFSGNKYSYAQIQEIKQQFHQFNQQNLN